MSCFETKCFVSMGAYLATTYPELANRLINGELTVEEMINIINCDLADSNIDFRIEIGTTLLDVLNCIKRLHPNIHFKGQNGQENDNVE